jgi:carbonic anhydrase/acetyltransferase-like protein (isoleucine patch superfamily)
MTDSPLILPYRGVSPVFAGPVAAAAPGAAVLGRATLGAGARLGPRSVIRADGHHVRAGEDLFLGEASTVHIAHDLHPAEMGSGVTVGRNAVIHACTVGDGCWFGEHVVVLDGSVIGPGAAFEAGSVVFPGTALDGGWLYAGMPAKPVRPLPPEDLAALHRDTRAAPFRGDPIPPPLTPEGAIFVAATARLAGEIAFSGGIGVWFGCDLDAGTRRIAMGEATNVQDNSVLRARDADLVIGTGTTIGHNVTMTDATVGDRSLIGIGAVLAPGTVVGDGTLVAAGARTTPGQVLEASSFYAGSPAVRRGPLDDRKRQIIAATTPTYRGYATRFAAEQAAAASA